MGRLRQLAIGKRRLPPAFQRRQARLGGSPPGDYSLFIARLTKPAPAYFADAN